MEIFGFAAALLMGMTLGILGGGGSILTVPILVYLFHLSPTVATGYSLFIVGLTALIGSATYIRKGEVNYPIGLTFAVPGFMGVYTARNFILPAVPNEIGSISSFLVTKDLLLMVMFAVLMLFASFSMIRKKAEKPKATHTSQLKRYTELALRGLLVGAVTGFIGAGGGFLIIPALVFMAKLEMKMAVGTSLLIITANSLLGFLSNLSQQPDLDWAFLFTFSGIAILGIITGSFLSKKIPDQLLKKAFGWFILIMGSAVLIEQIF